MRCFRNVAARLAPDGAFVIETFVPGLVRYGERGESLRAVDVGSRVRLDVSRLDRVRQRVSTRQRGTLHSRRVVPARWGRGGRT